MAMMRMNLRMMLWFLSSFEVQGDVELGREAPHLVDLLVVGVLADPWWTAPLESMRGRLGTKVAHA